MCGIVGLLIKNPALHGKLGAWTTPMLIEMAARGPESAGLAVFRDEEPEPRRKISLQAPAWDYDFAPLERDLRALFGDSVEVSRVGNHALVTGAFSVDTARPWLESTFPELHVLSAGRAIDMFKDVGHPQAVAERYAFRQFEGTHVVAHTRMATESAVTPDRAHPFTAGEDFCLVHNGTISNPFMIRRRLEREGIAFQTDNDSEAACRYLEWRLRAGDDLRGALERGFEDLDGFYTFLIGTRNELALVRDAFACKPAIAAETADYVAIASEFRALAHLPGIDSARLFEPMPREVYSWSV